MIQNAQEFCNNAIHINSTLNITYFWTATAISGPIPSPGIRVTVLLPGAELINLWQLIELDVTAVLLTNFAKLFIILDYVLPKI